MSTPMTDEIRVNAVARLIWDKFAQWSTTSQKPTWDEMVAEKWCLVDTYRDHVKEILEVADRFRQPIMHGRDERGNWICCCGDHLEDQGVED